MPESTATNAVTYTTQRGTIRVACEVLPARLNRIENSISCDNVFNGNVGPDFDQVLIGKICADNRKHS
ncbi:hypothetical protein GV67_20865 [Pseudorhizobium pelagicum]|uniref:Uncharacterized protein n=1 Tax=Pseudorhizobium pelagicum TaxID=1509405 RepID=A0A922P311_9HYPH|nr:hypothetical protein GV67_20865 [Pseudorhizobium pelagicum]KEQ05821.1 hypothetical protein GV68_07915 [Pseudorhizobium pelagicum]